MSHHFLLLLRLIEEQWIWLAPQLVGVASHSAWLTPAYQTPVQMEALAKLRGQDMYASASWDLMEPPAILVNVNPVLS